MSLAPEAQPKRCEPDRLSRRAMYGFLGVLIVAAVVMHVGVWWLYRDLIETPRAVDARSSVVSADDVSGYRTLPTLNEDGAAAQRAQENQVFEKLGWRIDSRTQRAAIPDAVIDAVAKRQQGG
jgi:hypothetical protein